MPKGLKGEKRAADVIGNAVKIMRMVKGALIDAREVGGLAQNTTDATLDLQRVAYNRDAGAIGVAII